MFQVVRGRRRKENRGPEASGRYGRISRRAAWRTGEPDSVSGRPWKKNVSSFFFFLEPLSLKVG